MKKVLALFLLLGLVNPVFASVGFRDAGGATNAVTDLDCYPDSACSSANGVATFDNRVAGITSGTIAGVTSLATTGNNDLGDSALDETTVTGLLYLPYVAKTAKPASGLATGAVVLTTGTNKDDCGHGTVGAASTYTICYSDGTNWVSL